MQQIFLIPGFLGFRNLGELGYFQGVPELLSRVLAAEHGIRADVIPLSTAATASLPRRAYRLLEEMRHHVTDEVEGVHLVGHSTGGLDIRLLLSPETTLEGEIPDEALLSRVKTAITLSTPHFGTPIASLALSLNLQLLVAALACFVTSEGIWRRLAAGTSQLLYLAQFGDRFGLVGTPVDWLAEVLGGEGAPELREYLEEIQADQGSLLQLTPAGTHLFNAGVRDRDGIDYVSYASVVPPPGRFESDVIFQLAHAAVANADERYPLSWLEAGSRSAAETALGVRIDAASNDGVVPALSQIHARLGGIVRGDHLDVVGLFPRDGKPGDWQPPWLSSGAGFTEERFHALWSAIAADVAGAGTDADPLLLG